MLQAAEKHKNLIRSLLFLTVLVLVFLKVQTVFRNNDIRFYQSVTVLREERPGTIDAVYIGASNVHCFWIPVSAWQNHGISVLSLTSNSMPVASWIYMIEEVRKTQPDALIILNINPFKADTGPDQVKLHRIADYMPLSVNKLRMIRDLSDDMGFGLTERLEFYFPLIRFHSKWKTLSSSDFNLRPDGIKNGLIYVPHWRYIQDLTDLYVRYSKEEDLTEQQGRDLAKLIDYLDRKKPNILFITVPQAIEDKTLIGQMNKVESILKDHGYPCLNLLNEPEKIGVLLNSDFYDQGHTNVHGALKYTEFLSQYLIENYSFRDKRSEPGWENWDKANERYTEFIKPYTLPFERNAGQRDYDLSAPEQIAADSKNGQVVLSWTGSQEADAYEIWRKNGGEKSGDAWQMCEQVQGDQFSFADVKIQPGKEYSYTIVPLRIEAGNEVYGNFSYKGVSVKTK